MTIHVSRQFCIFLLTGGIAAAVNLVSRILYNAWFDFSVAVFLAYATGMLTAFVLAKIFVFKQSRQSTAHSVFFFVLVNLLAALQTWGISMFLAYKLLPWLGVHRWVAEIAHTVGVVCPVFTSYVGHKRWSFAI